MRKISYDDLEWRVECLSEDTPIEGNAMSSGDDDLDRRVERRISQDFEGGNQWAWCTVKVSCWLPMVPQITGEDYLGCCNYDSESDFRCGGYFDDMKEQAYDDLTMQLSVVEKEIE